MIFKKQKNGSIFIYTVEPDNDINIDSLKNTFVTSSQINFIIDHDADVYTTDGKLLLKFRKNVLLKNNIDNFYDNIIQHANRETTNRGSTTGSNSKNIYNNPKTKTNIFGFFDKWSPRQKFIFKKLKIKFPISVRECRFNQDDPEKYKKTLPLIEDIDKLYQKLTPQQYDKQRKKADQTHFKIPNTSFTTVTTNINFQTTMHTDKGDDPDGFGNLVVIEKGEYEGGQTCFPKYSIGVDVRNGDVLFMDVHEVHGNLPIKLKSPDAIRLSVVCYLRKKIWEMTKNKTKKFYIKHNETVKKSKNYRK